LLSNTKPNQIYLNKVTLLKNNTDKSDVNKYFLTVVVFIISLFAVSSLLTISGIKFENSFKLGILTIMNTVNSSMYGLADFNFYSINIISKLSLIIFMIIGRIELLTILILIKKFLFKN
tara:strand:- start:18 stop:374 length:357 start_codon:yes stop_codon:yes gene_type:complete